VGQFLVVVGQQPAAQPTKPAWPAATTGPASQRSTMVDSTMVVGPDWLRKQMQKASLDLLREVVEAFVAALMSAEADAVCIAPYGVVSDGEHPRRLPASGLRHRVGTLGVAIPKLRTGSYFPDSENLRGGWLVASDPFPD